MNLTTPTVMDDATVAFPTHVFDLMPTWAQIPDEFTHHGQKWVQFQSDWFFYGITTEGLIPKAGIDKKAAMRHLSAINVSWEPKHEHKSAAVAYLASLWFEESSTWTKVKP